MLKNIDNDFTTVLWEGRHYLIVSEKDGWFKLHDFYGSKYNLKKSSLGVEYFEGIDYEIIGKEARYGNI